MGRRSRSSGGHRRSNGQSHRRTHSARRPGAGGPRKPWHTAAGRKHAHSASSRQSTHSSTRPHKPPAWALSVSTDLLPRRINFRRGAHPSSRSNAGVSHSRHNNDASGSMPGVSKLTRKGSAGQRMSVSGGNCLEEPRLRLFDVSRMRALGQWQSPSRIGPGLRNLGNTCFLNSLLQALMYTAPLVNYLNSEEHIGQCAVVGYCLFCEMSKLCRVIHKRGAGGAVAPSRIVRNLRVLNKSFRIGRQEDAHEFLRCAMEFLQKNALARYKSVKDDRVKETSIVHSIFGGYLRSQVRCLKCQHVSNKYDPFLDISLEVHRCNNIMKALQHFTAAEKLTKDNQYLCSKCKIKVNAVKTLTIHTAPPVLSLALKRFSFSRYGGKISKFIAFPRQLDLSPFLSERKAGMQYSLYAVVVHLGSSLHGGHYIAYVKSSNGLWYCMDDSSVRQANIKTVLAQRGYILFYQRDNIPATNGVGRQQPATAGEAPSSDEEMTSSEKESEKKKKQKKKKKKKKKEEDTEKTEQPQVVPVVLQPTGPVPSPKLKAILDASPFSMSPTLAPSAASIPNISLEPSMASVASASSLQLKGSLDGLQHVGWRHSKFHRRMGAFTRAYAHSNGTSADEKLPPPPPSSFVSLGSLLQWLSDKAANGGASNDNMEDSPPSSAPSSPDSAAGQRRRTLQRIVNGVHTSDDQELGQVVSRDMLGMGDQPGGDLKAKRRRQKRKLADDAKKKQKKKNSKKKKKTKKTKEEKEENVSMEKQEKKEKKERKKKKKKKNKTERQKQLTGSASELAVTSTPTESHASPFRDSVPASDLNAKIHTKKRKVAEEKASSTALPPKRQLARQPQGDQRVAFHPAFLVSNDQFGVGVDQWDAGQVRERRKVGATRKARSLGHQLDEWDQELDAGHKRKVKRRQKKGLMQLSTSVYNPFNRDLQ